MKRAELRHIDGKPTFIMDDNKKIAVTNSVRNIECMKRWYLFYNEHLAKSQQAVAQLPQNFALVPWSHHVMIISKSKKLNPNLLAS